MSLKTKLKGVKRVHSRYSRLYGICFRGLAFISPRWFYAVKCRISVLKRWPDLRNPKTYADKMVWLIVNWRHPLKSRCADKYAVRDYVKECGCEEILIPLIGAWDRVEDIDFYALPQRFVLKCNPGCGCNILCKDKTKLDVEDAKRKLRRWMSVDYGKYSGEIHYSSIKPKIICEEYLDAGEGVLPTDYKCFCFGGKFFCCDTIAGRPTNFYSGDTHGAFREFVYDKTWTRMRLLRCEEDVDENIPCPPCYDKMIKMAEKLSGPFPMVRVDFYSVGGRLYFGELTFTSSGGLGVGWSDEAQKIMGDLIQLPEPIK